MADTKSHMTHPEKTFVCENCGKMYKYQNVFTKHARQCVPHHQRESANREQIVRPAASSSSSSASSSSSSSSSASAPSASPPPPPPNQTKAAEYYSHQLHHTFPGGVHSLTPYHGLNLSNSSVSQVSQQTAPLGGVRASAPLPLPHHHHHNTYSGAPYGARDFGKIVVNVLSNARFQNFLISLKREQGDIGKVFVNEQHARTVFEDDAPVWKAVPSVAALLMRGSDGGGGGGTRVRQRDDTENRVRLAYVTEWFVGHFTRDFAHELLLVMDTGAKVLARGGGAAPALPLLHPAEQFRANLVAKKKQLPLFFKLKPEAQTIFMDFLFNEFLEPLVRFAALSGGAA